MRPCVSAVSSRERAGKDIVCNYKLPQMHHCFRPALDTANSTGHEPAFAASPANRNSRYAGEGHQTHVCLLYPKWCTAAAEPLTGPILDLIYAVPGRSAQHLFPLSRPAASMARRYYAHNSPAPWRTHLAKISILIEGDALLALISSPQTPPAPRRKKEKIAPSTSRVDGASSYVAPDVLSRMINGHWENVDPVFVSYRNPPRIRIKSRLCATR